jgi:DNA processing protein
MTPTPARDIEAWLRLALVPGVGPVTQRKLIEHFGSPRSALAARPDEIAQFLGDRAAAGHLSRGADRALLDKALAWSSAHGNHVITLDDADYPRALREIHDPPPVIYARGRIGLLNAPALAIVGSRNPTPQGSRDAEAFAQALSNAGLCIVSGVAIGIDAAAHRGGLSGVSASIGVLGTGVDRTYPRGNDALGERLAAEGCLVSEFPLGTAPARGNFPRRNRLISGLSRGVLVVEAATGSGSLITAKAALEQSRDVLAIPGSIHAPLSKGCHALIKEGAKLVESVDDVLHELRIVADREPPRARAHEEREADPVLDAMGRATLSIDQLVALTGLGASQLAAHLARLEMRGAVAALPGGRFQRAEPRVIE